VKERERERERERESEKEWKRGSLRVWVIVRECESKHCFDNVLLRCQNCNTKVNKKERVCWKRERERVREERGKRKTLSW
jgi:hypothetical protein